jgi:hypothetical protein
MLKFLEALFKSRSTEPGWSPDSPVPPVTATIHGPTSLFPAEEPITSCDLIGHTVGNSSSCECCGAPVRGDREPGWKIIGRVM